MEQKRVDASIDFRISYSIIKMEINIKTQRLVISNRKSVQEWCRGQN